MAKKADNESPLMKQHAELKKKFPDALLLFRVGDFYETFGEDARRASQILGLTLTRKMAGGGEYTDLAGVPYHALEQYLPRLVKSGLRVAICEQLEDPKSAKGLVKRGITELVTPGVAYNDMVLEVKENNFLCGLHLTDKVHGISFLDVSTGEFYVAQGDLAYIDKLLTSFHPAEVVLQRKQLRWFQEHFPERYYCNTFDDWVFTPDFAHELLLKQFGTASLKGFGVEDLGMGIIAAGAVLYYLQDTQHDRTANITSLSRVERDRYVWLDRFTVRNLELVASPNDGARTLLDVVDQTLTPMGSRLMRRWVLMPLKEVAPIEERLAVVDTLVRDAELRQRLAAGIKTIGDLERLITKAAVGRIGPREMQQLRRSLEAVAEVKQVCTATDAPALRRIAEQMNPCVMLAQRIGRELRPEPPAKVEKGGVMAEGVSEELDRLRKMAGSGKEYLAALQQRESEATGIPSLKVGFNNVFGYYFEVYNTHRDKVPQEWTRRQTLTNAERYITPELKEYEDQILGAEDAPAEPALRLQHQHADPRDMRRPAQRAAIRDVTEEEDAIRHRGRVPRFGDAVQRIVAEDPPYAVRSPVGYVVERRLPAHRKPEPAFERRFRLASGIKSELERRGEVFAEEGMRRDEIHALARVLCGLRRQHAFRSAAHDKHVHVHRRGGARVGRRQRETRERKAQPAISLSNHLHR